MSTITSQVKTYIDPACCSNVTKARKGEVIITEISKNSESSCKSIIWMGDEDVVTSQQCLIATPDNEKIDGVYLAYFFNSNSFLKQKCSFIAGSSIFHINTSDIEKILIPLPPLEIQRAIANFLLQIAKPVQYTKYGLSEELNLRKEQLNTYLSKLTQKHRSTAKHVKLEDVASYISDKVSTKELNVSNYISVENLLQEIAGKVDSPNVPEQQIVNAYQEQDILLGNIRPYLHKIWFATHDGGCNQDVLIIRPHSPAILPKYLFFVLCAPEFWLHNERFTRTGALVRGDKQKIMHYEFPLPSIEEQEKVISFLEKLHELTFSGVAKELNLRQKQITYYIEDLKCLFPQWHYQRTNTRWAKIKQLDFKVIRYIPLKKLANLTLGRSFKVTQIQQSSTAKYPLYSAATENMGEVAKLDTYDYDGEYLTWTSRGYAGEVFYRNEKFSITNLAGLIENTSTDILSTKYLYAILKAVSKSYVNQCGGLPMLNVGVMEEIEIPIIPIELQEQIGDFIIILEKLISYSDSSMDKEIALREKQFNYYIDLFF